uniref:Uncharacterized protein n=1 Tax=Periophthalmus magnuspinnatus TaxID=409849 RepID=A0A3B3ZKU2_9GOBI
MMATSGDRSLRPLLLLLPVLGLCGALPGSWLPGSYSNTVDGVLAFLSDYNRTAEEVLYYSVTASWNYNTNLTEHNSQLQVQASMDEQAFSEAWGQKAKSTFTTAVLDSLPNKQDRKLFDKIVVLGPANLPTTDRQEYNTILKATRSSSSPGRAGTMHPEFPSKNTTQDLWISVTKAL